MPVHAFSQAAIIKRASHFINTTDSDCFPVLFFPPNRGEEFTAIFQKHKQVSVADDRLVFFLREQWREGKERERERERGQSEREKGEKKKEHREEREKQGEGRKEKPGEKTLTWTGLGASITAIETSTEVEAQHCITVISFSFSPGSSAPHPLINRPKKLLFRPSW